MSKITTKIKKKLVESLGGVWDMPIPYEAMRQSSYFYTESLTPIKATIKINNSCSPYEKEPVEKLLLENLCRSLEGKVVIEDRVDYYNDYKEYSVEIFIKKIKK